MADNHHTPAVVSRQTAKAQGLSHYFTGVPCANGHVSPRSTKGKQCVACHRERQAKFRAENPEKDKAIKAASYRRHADEAKAKAREYHHENKDDAREKRRAYRQANSEKIAARYAAWAAANRDLLRVHERKRRARKKNAAGSHTLPDIREIEKAQRDRCAAPNCRRRLHGVYHVDHIVPLALGGTNDRRNLQLLCASCNHAKHAKDPIEWARSLGQLL